MTDNVLLIDEKTGARVTENDLLDIEDDRCPFCSVRVETENEKTIMQKNSRALGIIKKTGRLIKKCKCKHWLRMPYTINRIRAA